MGWGGGGRGGRVSGWGEDCKMKERDRQRGGERVGRKERAILQRILST